MPIGGATKNLETAANRSARSTLFLAERYQQPFGAGKTLFAHASTRLRVFAITERVYLLAVMANSFTRNLKGCPDIFDTEISA